MSGLPVTPPPRPRGTAALVAPELAPGLDLFPTVELDDALLAVMRTGGPIFETAPLTPAQEAVARTERHVPGPDGAPDVRVLVYMPAAPAPRPAYLHIHGGGYVLGAPDMNDGANRALAAALGCVVVSVDYRLAPETRAPGPVEDCYAALRWLHGEADILGIDRARIAIGGESAGGGLAAALALLARDRGEIPVCFQYLDSPMLDDRTGSTADPDPHPHAGEFVWTPQSNRFGWRALLDREPGGADVPAHLVPARATRLSGLPPTYIVVGAIDLFVEEDMDYARRLIRAGVATELHVIPGAFHGFGIVGEAAPQVRRHQALARAALARAFGAASQD